MNLLLTGRCRIIKVDVTVETSLELGGPAMATTPHRRIAAAFGAAAVVLSVAACSGTPHGSRDNTGTHATVGTATFQVPAFLTRLMPSSTQPSCTQVQTAAQGVTLSSGEGCPIALPPG